MSTNWDDESRTSEQSGSHCALNVRLATWRQRLYILVFMLEADISRIWCKTVKDDVISTRLTIASLVCGYSICHFKVLKVLLAHIIGEVGTFTYFGVRFFRDMSTNFYWNWFIFDRHRAKNKLLRFLRHGVVCIHEMTPAAVTNRPDWISHAHGVPKKTTKLLHCNR